MVNIIEKLFSNGEYHRKVNQHYKISLKGQLAIVYIIDRWISNSDSR